MVFSLVSRGKDFSEKVGLQAEVLRILTKGGTTVMKIGLKTSQQLFFTSDTHAYHKNICQGVSEWGPDQGQRDFDTLEDMNNALVSGINNVVGAEDILIHLGDWSFGGKDKVGKFREQLNVKDIHLVLGNHDYNIRKNIGLQNFFTKVSRMMEVTVMGHSFVLLHFPLLVWEGISRGVINLHGHLHSRPEKRLGKGKQLDVGVDSNELKPYNVEEIIDLMKNRPINCFLADDYPLKERTVS